MHPLLLRPALLLLSAAALHAQAARSLPPPGTLKKMSVDELMNLQVTSVSKRPEKFAEVASAIQLITGDEIRRAGATSLPEALRLASNLEAAQVDSRQWAITARGFNNVFAGKMLVLVDGRIVYTPLYAGVYWDVQDTMLDDLDRIEVISGPGATQWGSNAVNGVINITTRNARDTQGGLVVTDVGTELRRAAAVRYGGSLAGNGYYRVYAQAFGRGDSRRTSGSGAKDDWHTQQAGFRADWETAAGDMVTFQGDAYGARMNQPGSDDIDANGANLLGRWARALGEKSSVQLQLYYDHTHRGMPGSFTQTLDVWDLDFQHRLPLGSAHDVVWGANARTVHDDIVNTPANAFLPPRVQHEWFSAFAQDEIALRENVRFTIGSKIEHNEYTGFEYEPSARLAWSVAENHTLWSAVSRAVRTPSRIDRDLYSPATPPYRVAGSRDVVSETLVACEAGYRAQVLSDLSLSLALFSNHYDDLRSHEPLNPPQPFPVEASNGLRGRSTGAEFSADWRVTARWRLRAGWTELRVHSEPQPGNVDRATGDSIARDPHRQLFLRSSFDLGRAWELDADLRHVSAIRFTSVPSYTELNLRLGWRPAPGWELSVAGQNLLHARHAEFNTPGSRREIERGVYARVAWSF